MPEATTFLLTGHNLLYLLGFLNSKLSEYMFSKIGTTTGVGTVRWKKFTIEQLKVPRLPLKQEKKYNELVLLIIAKIKNKEKYDELIHKLNLLIYSDLELTKEEIQFVESMANI